ncbi:MAG TPA: APC family permease [Candidatus Acidoferrum sp.]|nr:APC family permease [Candidatus Acidoferrum sp.]
MPEAAGATRPQQAMGFRDLVFFYIVTGISLRWIATAAAVGPSAVVIWLIAWSVFYLPLALSVMELSSRYPQEGGLYVWSREAFGEFPGFLTGWTYWVSNLPYYPAILYFAASNALFIGPERWQALGDNKAYFLVFSLTGILLVTFLNVIGLSVGKWVHNLGAIGTWLPIALLLGFGAVAWHRFGSATQFTLATMRPHMHFHDILFVATIVFALGGSESASLMGDEIRDARKNLPRGLVTGGIFVTIGYIAGTMAVLVALPAHRVSGLSGIMQAIEQAGGRVGWASVGPVAAVLIAVSNLGTLSAWLAVSARLPFVAGLNRYLPPAFAKIHPKWGTPHVAVIAQTVCAIAVILLGQAGTSVNGAYEVLVSMGIISYFIPYLFVFASLIRLQREPAGPDVMRIPGGRAVANLLGIVGFLSTSVTIVFSVMPSSDEPHPMEAVAKVVLLTGLLFVTGLVAYRWGKGHAARESAALAEQE